MSVRLVAADVDGTLLRSDVTLSERTREAARRAVDAGLIVVAVSGRQPFAIAQVLPESVFIGPCVGANGAVSRNLATGERYFEHLVDPDAQRALVAALAADLPGLRCASVRDGGDTFFPEFGYVELMRSGDHGRTDPGPEYPRDEVLAEGSVKLVIRHPVAGPEALLAAALAAAVPGCEPVTSGAPFLEVARAGVTKASGLADLCSRMGVAADEVVAIGDNLNDIAMLQWAGRGIAMGNALPAVKAAADEVTLSNDEDAVAVLLEELVA